MSKQLSVIIPTYNAEEYIERCIESLIFTIEHEIIIINDGSTDSTLSILEELQRHNNNVVIINQDNRGVSKARNKGIYESKGEYLLFLDSDDFLIDSMGIQKYLTRNIDLIVLGYILKSNNNYNKEIKFQKSITYNLKNNSRDFYNNYFIDKTFRGAVWNKIYRREKIIKSSVYFVDYNEVISEDTLFNLYYLMKNEIIVDIKSECHTVHDDIQNSLSNSNFQTNIVERTKNSIILTSKVLQSESPDATWLRFYYIIDYILKFSIIEITVNKVSYQEFKNDLIHILTELKLSEKIKVNEMTNYFIKNNRKIKLSYHLFIGFLIKKKYDNLLSWMLWKRYKGERIA